jgi:hypothetical protein
MRLSARERRLLALLGAIAALGAFRLLYLAASPPPPPRDPFAQPAARGARRGRAAAAPPKSVVLLATDRLARAGEGEFEVGRDLFRFGPPPPPPPPSAEELARLRREAEERSELAEAARREQAVPKPPAVTVRFLGSFGPDSRKIAVFTDAAGQSVWNARVGDVVAGKFVVARIGLESVDLGFVGFEQFPPARLAVGE